MYHSSMYPFYFKCYECTTDFSTLEQLECHVWNVHLNTFPFNCAICNYPALTEKALTSHFCDAHPEKTVEFKRNITVESQLRVFIRQSICLLGSEVIYGEEVVQDDLADMETLQPAEQEQFDMEQGVYGLNMGRRGSVQDKDLEESDQCDDQPPNLKPQIDDDSIDDEIMYLETMERQMNGQGKFEHSQDGVEIIEEEEGVEDEMEMAEEVIVEGIMEDEHHDGNHHQHGYLFDEDGNMFEDGLELQYIDEEDLFYDEREDLHSRIMKNRHMDMTVNKVAGSSHSMRGKKPATEDYCRICDKHLKYPSRIAAHHRMHSQEKAFQCPHCDKTFSQKSSLNVHIRTHTGEKPYACSWDCGKFFASSSALKMHEKTHTGERNYSCSVCGQLFSKRSHANRHERNRHFRRVNDGELEGASVDNARIGAEKSVVDEVVESVRTDKFNKNYIKHHRLAVKREPRDASVHESA